MHLQSRNLSVEISSMEKNPSTRFEHIPYVSSVIMDGNHTFLSQERTLAGPGTNGEGLMHGFLNLPEMDTFDDVCPVIGVGIVKVPPCDYSIRENYPCDFACLSLLASDEISASFLLHQTLSHGISYDLVRTFVLRDNTLQVDTNIINLGDRVIAAKQYCHNFFLFDGIQNGPSYHMDIPRYRNLHLVRGSVVLDARSYSPYLFDKTLGTMALTYDLEHEEREELVLSNTISGTSVTIENSFPILERYHWHSPWCVCPESFMMVRLGHGEGCRFSRTYTFR